MFANLMEKKIEMTKAEAAKAGKMGTDKYNELAALMERFPNFEIVVVKTNSEMDFHSLQSLRQHSLQEGLWRTLQGLHQADRKQKVLHQRIK